LGRCQVLVPGGDGDKTPSCHGSVVSCSTDNDWQIVCRIIFNGTQPEAGSFMSMPFAHGDG